MPSKRITKTNIDRDTLIGLQLAADVEGISSAQLIDKMFLLYMRTYGTTPQIGI